MKEGASGAESAPFGLFWEAILRVNTRAAMVRFGAAVVRICAAVWRVGAGEAHQGAEVNIEQRHSKRVLLAVFWRFLAIWWGQRGSKTGKWGKMSKGEQMGTFWGLLGYFWRFLDGFQPKTRFLGISR